MSRWLSLALALLALGCVGVPQPEPPSLDPVGVTPIPRGRNTAFAYAVAPGSIEPARGQLWVVGLDDVTDPLLLPVLDDGSVAEFEVSSSVIRVQARNGDERADPWDFARVADEATLLAPANPCAAIDLELEVGSVQVGREVTATVAIVNDCAEAVVLGAAAMRRPSDLRIDAAPSRVEPGSRALFTVALTPSAVGLREEVLLIPIESPTPERRAVTLFGFGLP